MKKNSNQAKTLKIPENLHLLLKKVSAEQGGIPLYGVIANLMLDYFLAKREKF